MTPDIRPAPERIVIDRGPLGNVVSMDPHLVLRARLAIRRRRDEALQIVKVAA